MYKKVAKIQVGDDVYAVINGVPVHGILMSVDEMEAGLSGCHRVQYKYIRITYVMSEDQGDQIMLGTTWRAADVEMIACNVFDVGDKVQSTLIAGGAKFEVTGFEERTNRVICLSLHKQPEDRFRYAYKVEELRAIYSDVFIEIGQKYVLNNRHAVVAAEYPNYKGLLQLVVTTGDEQGKVYLLKTSEGKVCKDALERAGIEHICEA